MSATSTALVPPSPQTLTTRPSPATAAASAPSTPTAKLREEPKPSPGTFRHPRLTEIIRRQSKTTLTESNIRTAVINVLAITLSFAFRYRIYQILNFVLSFTPLASTDSIPSFTVAAIRILFLTNALLSLRPILPYSKPATYDDIPLTPSQRALLGLPPNTKGTPTASQTPGTQSTAFITPPRYTRRLSSSSASPSTQLAPSTDRRSISANYSSSPLSTSRHTLGFSPSPNNNNNIGSPTSTFRRTASGSPFSPSGGSLAGSPLFHKAVHNRDRSAELAFDVSARTSVAMNGAAGGSPRSLGLWRSQSMKEQGSPARRRGDGDGGEREPRSPVQKGVNYKWLYDKGFALSRSGSMGF